MMYFAAICDTTIDIGEFIPHRERGKGEKNENRASTVRCLSIYNLLKPEEHEMNIFVEFTEFYDLQQKCVMNFV